VSESFCNNRNNFGTKLSTDVALAAQSSATVVLMGMSKLNEIVAIFSKEAKGETPVAIIQNGTTQRRK
jgi:uroporphyrin-III C-methyltransferase